MSKLQFKNKWVLVTGASSGLGAEIARQLACQHGANLILLARRKEKLERLQSELEKHVSVRIIVADLSKPGDVDSAIDEVLKDGRLYGAVLNAGVTHFGLHEELPWEDFLTMLQTNVTAVVRMTNRLTTHFETSGSEGGILVVSSMAAIFPIPFQAAYSGTKSFILSFTMALTQEIKNRRFSITVYTPGGIITEMTAGEKFNDLRGWLVPVKQAAKEGLSAFSRRKLVYIPGLTNQLGNVFFKFLPKKFIMNRMSNVYKKSLLNAEKSNSKP